MVWQVVALLLFPLILAFANHKFRQMRDREDRQDKERAEMISRHKQACGDMLDGARQVRLAATLERDRHKSTVTWLITDAHDITKVAVTGVKIGCRAFRRQEMSALTRRCSRGPLSDARDDAQPPAGRVRRKSGRRVRATRSAA